MQQQKANRRLELADVQIHGLFNREFSEKHEWEEGSFFQVRIDERSGSAQCPGTHQQRRGYVVGRFAQSPAARRHVASHMVDCVTRTNNQSQNGERVTIVPEHLQCRQ